MSPRFLFSAIVVALVAAALTMGGSTTRVGTRGKDVPHFVTYVVVGNPMAQRAPPVVGIFLQGGNGSSCLFEGGGLFTVNENNEGDVTADAKRGWYRQPKPVLSSSASCASGVYWLRNDEHGLRPARAGPTA